MRLAIFSDLHVHAWAEHSRDDDGAPSRLRHCVSVLRRVRWHCVEQGITEVLFGGDLFHKRGVLYTQAYNLVVEELAEWKRCGLRLGAGVGNHDLADRAGKVHALQALESAGLLHTVGGDGWANWIHHAAQEDEKDVVVTAIAYCPGAEELRRRTDAALEDRLTSFDMRDGFTVGLFHHGFKGARVGTSLEYMVKEEADPNAYAKSFDVMFCVDEETEALTPDGWKRHGDLRKGSLIACVTPEQGKFTWLPIQRMNRGPSPGSMLSFGGGRSHVDHVVTDNHMMWIRKDTGSWMSVRADEVFGTSIHRPFIIQTAAPRFGGTWSWRGPTLAGSELDAAEFVGWYLAEGAISKDSRRGRKPSNVAIAKSISAYPDEYDRICALVTRLGFNPSHHNLMIRVCSSSFAKWMLTEFGDGCVNKRIPAWVKNWPKQHLDRLVRTMIEGDGHEIHAGLATYDTVSKRLADDLQEVCIKLGWSSTLSTRKRKNRKRIYTLTIVRRELPEREFTQRRRRIKYTGTVWCPTVETGLWFARRNGRVIVTKNSGHYHAHQEIGSQGNAWYVGSPMEFVRGETSPKGFLVLDTDLAEIERVDLDLPRFVKLTGAEIADDDFDVEAHVRGNFVDVVFEELPLPWDKVEATLVKLGAAGVRAVPTREDKLPKSSRLQVDPTVGDRQLLEAYMDHVQVEPSERADLLRAGLELLEDA